MKLFVFALRCDDFPFTVHLRYILVPCLLELCITGVNFFSVFCLSLIVVVVLGVKALTNDFKALLT